MLGGLLRTVGELPADVVGFLTGLLRGLGRLLRRMFGDANTVARVSLARRLRHLSSPSDTKTLIETAVERFLDEVPALQQLKLVAGLELRGRGDVQLYRVRMPGPNVTKSIPSDAKVTLAV